MKNIFKILAAALIAFSMQACLFEDNEVFEKSASVRIQEAVDDVKAALVSSPNGWLLHYWTGENYSGAGYNVVVRFDDQYAYVSADFDDVEKVAHSSWDVKKDQGPVLTFDTYNEIMHAMSNPSSGAIDGSEGDYEFVVLSISQNEIQIKGKKWKNYMTLTRVADDFVWSEYLEGGLLTLKNIGAKYKTPSELGILFNTSSRRMTTDEDGVGVSFYPTADGIWLATPYEIDGVEINGFSFNNETMELTCEAFGGEALEEVPIPLSQLFLTGEWFLTLEYGCGASALNYFNMAKAALAKKGEILGYLYFGEFTTDTWGFATGCGNDDNGYNSVAMNMNPTIVDDNTVTLAMGGSIWGGIEYWSTYGFQYLMNVFKDTFTIEAVDDPKRPSVLHLVPVYAGWDFYVCNYEVDYPLE